MSQAHESNSTPTQPDAARPLSLSDRVRSLRLPERNPPPRQGRAWLPWVLCLLFLGTTVALALRPPAESSASDDAKKPDAGQPAVQAANVGAIALEAKGYIIPVQQIQVSPKISGMVMKLNIEEGMNVPRNFILAELEDVEYKSEHDRTLGLVHAAEARLKELENFRQAEVDQLDADLKDLESQRDRNKKLLVRLDKARENKAASDQEYEDAESAYQTLEQRVRRADLALKLMKSGPRDARIESTKAEIKQAKADYVKAKWRLDSCQVKAPIKGTILTKKTEYGAMVNPSAFSNGLAASLCDMADLSKLEVDLAIAERDVHKVAKGQTCKIRAEAFPDKIFDGEVSRLMPIADRSKGAVPVRVRIDIKEDDAGKYLRPEMGAIVTFYNAPKKN
jgi:HlyD family secretion protein